MLIPLILFLVSISLTARCWALSVLLQCRERKKVLKMRMQNDSCKSPICCPNSFKILLRTAFLCGFVIIQRCFGYGPSHRSEWKLDQVKLLRLAEMKLSCSFLSAKSFSTIHSLFHLNPFDVHTRKIPPRKRIKIIWKCKLKDLIYVFLLLSPEVSLFHFVFRRFIRAHI